MEKPSIIACHLYDYIEIACMYKLEVRAVFKNGSDITGQAIDTAIIEFDTGAKECLLVKTDDKDNLQSIVLSELASLSAVTENPHFDVVHF